MKAQCHLIERDSLRPTKAMVQPPQAGDIWTMVLVEHDDRLGITPHLTVALKEGKAREHRLVGEPWHRLPPSIHVRIG